MALAVAEEVAGVPDHVGVGEIDVDKIVFCEIFQNTLSLFLSADISGVNS